MSMKRYEYIDWHFNNSSLSSGEVRDIEYLLSVASTHDKLIDKIGLQTEAIEVLKSNLDYMIRNRCEKCQRKNISNGAILQANEILKGLE